MKRILFVDDEQCVLDGLRDLLRRDRRQWEMVFACGPDAALKAMENTEFDVVVSDMRMAGMDGAQLLHRVKDLSPRTVRLILSGQSGRDALLHALPVTHQFLSKPCDVNLLRKTIERMTALGAFLDDPNLRACVGKIDSVPSVPAVYVELSQVASNEAASLSDLAKVIEKDGAMTAKVLQLVNSPYFGLVRKEISIQQAVTHLGLNFLKSMMLSISVLGSGRVKADDGAMSAYHAHAMVVSRIARRIALSERPSASGGAITAAMLHDIGKLVMLVNADSRGLSQLIQALCNGEEGASSDQELFGVTHGAVGGYLLALWGLPNEVVEAVTHHHAPRLAKDPQNPILMSIHVAESLACGWSGPANPISLDRVDRAFVESLGLTHRLEMWADLAREEMVTACVS